MGKAVTPADPSLVYATIEAGEEERGFYRVGLQIKEIEQRLLGSGHEGFLPSRKQSPAVAGQEVFPEVAEPIAPERRGGAAEGRTH